MQECSWQMFNVMVGLHGIEADPIPRSYTGLEGLWNVGVTRFGNRLKAHVCVLFVNTRTHNPPNLARGRASYACDRVCILVFTDSA